MHPQLPQPVRKSTGVDSHPLSKKTAQLHASTLAAIGRTTRVFFRPFVPRIDVDFEVGRIIVGVVTTCPDVLEQGIFEVLRSDPFRN